MTRGAAGWAGGPAGTTGEEVPDQSEGCSADECACTAKVYAVPLVKPVHVYEVPVMPGFSVTPPAAGLIRTFFSSYWRLRSSLGLTRYAEPDMIERLAAAGFAALRAPHNVGHNDARMTFLARRADQIR